MTAPGWRGAIVPVLFSTALDAWAQVSGSVTVVSDYRFRGLSLSEERPAIQAGVAYDHASGLYAGLFGSTVRFAFDSRRGAQIVSYLGYAQRLRSDLSWEIGADYASFTDAAYYDYPEVYLGVSFDKLSGRIYYAPRYFGLDSEAVYTELNTNHAFLTRFRLLGHVGLLRQKNPYATGEAARRDLWDVRLGVGMELARFQVQLAWVARSPIEARYPGAEGRRQAVVLSLSRAF